MKEPTAKESKLLGAFKYQSNDTFLHTDTRLMPHRKIVWSSWNYLSNNIGKEVESVSVTYWMNQLQGLNTQDDYLVSLNPINEPNPDKVIRRINYHHPVFDTPAIKAQQHLEQLQGVHNTWFAGSYFGYGFHEDALASAVNLCEELGVIPPWKQNSNETLPAWKSAA